MSPLSEHQIKSWQEGNCTNAWEVLGAHPAKNGFRFEVWAPNARRVFVVGDFNDWDPKTHSMNKDAATGIWSVSVPEACAGQCYKFHITSKKGSSVLKADPYGFFHEKESHHASVIYDLPDYSWSDEGWLDRRASLQQPDQPIAIYEVHLGSWRRSPSDDLLTYRELAASLVPYVKEMGFTHIELMPVMEHPYGPSWGYQVTGYFAPTSRYGTPEDFMAFIDACHRHDIGVILDWVPGHFPRDEHGLSFFDGTPLYEHDDVRRREHADWGTHNFDLAKEGVRNFLLSNAFFWCEKYHIDGFRVDAVASMLYLDYSKSDGAWLPNKYGGNENLSAISFLQDLNDLLNQHHPSVLTFAEESTAWPGVTNPVSDGGLGFDYKWNMGWMNDTLRFFEKEPEERGHESHSITFPITFAFSEHFLLPFSHDEVVHLKKSLLGKMPGTADQKFAQLKLLFLFMIGSSGKKLLFMGSELAQKEEWSEGRGLDWSLIEDEPHKEIQQFTSRLLQLYKSTPALHRADNQPEGFRWEDLSRKEEGLYVFSRSSEDPSEKLIFVFNFSANPVGDYHIGFNVGELILNTLSVDEEPTDIEEPITLQPLQGIVIRQQ